MPHIHSIQMAYPDHYYDQDSLIEILGKKWRGKFFNPERVEQIQRNILVGGRHLALPLEEYTELKGFGEKNNRWIEISLNLAEKAVTELIEKANIIPEDISLLMSNTITGLAVPSLEARLLNRIPFSPQIKRVPLFGLGCLAGVAGINRGMDYLKGHPHEAIIFFSVELCSLTIQMDDLSIPNIISTGLFSDGAAAVLMVGDEHPMAQHAPLKFLNSRSSFFPKTERVMGWDVVDNGLKIVLSSDVPKICREKIPAEFNNFLKENKMSPKEINFFMAHPGGPKVMTALEESLDLPKDALAHSWNSLRERGNMSSVSILDITKQTINTLNDNQQYGVMLALGPAFCSEMGLFQCQR